VSEFRVFLRGQVGISQTLGALEALRPLDVLDGPLGPADLLGVRDGVLVELLMEHEEGDCHGLPVSGLPVLVRFADGSARSGSGPGRAWTAAHAFLWMVTRRCEVEEALLAGTDSPPLHFRGGRIRPVLTPEER
jgi:hypothetical protein